MALPQGNNPISLGQIRANLRPEDGASNTNVNLGGYYRNSANVGNSFSHVDAGNSSTQLTNTAGHLHMSHFWSGSYIQEANAVPDSFSTSVTDPDDCILQVTWHANCRVDVTNDGTLETATQGIEPFELGPPGAADWEMRITKIGGNTSFTPNSTIANNSWTNLGGAVEVINTGPTAPNEKDVYAKIEFRRKSNTEIRVTKANVTFKAIIDSA